MFLGVGLRAWAQVLRDCKLSSDRTLPDLRFCQNAERTLAWIGRYRRLVPTSSAMPPSLLRSSASL